MLMWLYKRIPRRLKNWYFERQLKNEVFALFDRRVNESQWSHNEMLLWMQIGVRWSQNGLKPGDAERGLAKLNPELFERMQEEMLQRLIKGDTK